MIIEGTALETADNTGVKKVVCIRVLGNKSSAAVGDIIVVSVKDTNSNNRIKKGSVHRAVVVRTKYALRRKDGSYISFDNNAVVLINKSDMQPIGTRIFGPIPHELSSCGFFKIVSLAMANV